MATDDFALPHLIGLTIGIARNDDFVIGFCGREVKNILSSKAINVRGAVGELESVVILMKAAVSKNHAADKIDALFS